MAQTYTLADHMSTTSLAPTAAVTIRPQRSKASILDSQLFRLQTINSTASDLKNPADLKPPKCNWDADLQRQICV